MIHECFPHFSLSSPSPSVVNRRSLIIKIVVFDVKYRFYKPLRSFLLIVVRVRLFRFDVFLVHDSVRFVNGPANVQHLVNVRRKFLEVFSFEFREQCSSFLYENRSIKRSLRKIERRFTFVLSIRDFRDEDFLIRNEFFRFVLKKKTRRKTFYQIEENRRFTDFVTSIVGQLSIKFIEFVIFAE